MLPPQAASHEPPGTVNAFLAKVTSGALTLTVTIGIYADRGKWPPNLRQNALIPEGSNWHASRPEVHVNHLMNDAPIKK